MIELASETDFVAKNEQFQTLAGDIVAHFADSSADRRRVAAAPRRSRTARPSRRASQALAAVIGEKLELRRAVKLDGQVATYLHRKASDLPPQVGVLVQFTGARRRGRARRGDAGRGDAAAYLTRDEVPAEVVETERRVAEEKTRDEGKPEQALAKIVEGRLNGFYKDNVLLEQASVQRAEEDASSRCSTRPASRVTKFAHFEVGQA